MKHTTSKSVILVAAIVMIAMLCSMNAAAANTTILYTSLGPQGQWSTTNGLFVNGSSYGDQAIGEQFTTTGAATIVNVQLPLSTFQSQGNNPVSLYLESGTGGDGGSPEHIITQLTQVGSIPSQPALVTFTCSQDCALQPNTPYWIVAVQSDPNSQDVWWWAYGNPHGYGAQNTLGSPTGPWTLTYGVVSGFQVNGVYACSNCGQL
jgi:hypothetical protein